MPVTPRAGPFGPLFTGIAGVSAVAMGAYGAYGSQGKDVVTQASVVRQARPVHIPIILGAGKIFIRIAGFSGASALVMAAYGFHDFYNKPDIPSELKDVYRITNYYHFMHSLALLAVPLTNRPLLVGTLLATGMSIFCGTWYAYALSGNRSYIQYTRYGGTLLVFAWLAMMF